MTTIYTVIEYRVFGGIENVENFLEADDAYKYFFNWANNNNTENLTFDDVNAALEWFRSNEEELDYTIDFCENMVDEKQLVESTSEDTKSAIIHIEIDKNSPSTAKIQELEVAVNEAKANCEAHIAKERCKFICDDKNAPKVLIDRMKKFDVRFVKIEEIVFNQGYMSDGASVMSFAANNMGDLLVEFIFNATSDFSVYYESDYDDTASIKDALEINEEEYKVVVQYLDRLREISFEQN